jgi:predicted ATPase
MQFRVLGPLEVGGGDQTLSLGGLRQRSVLALLVLHSGRVVPADQIVTEIWGEEAPDGARDSLYTYVSNLRGVLHRDRISRVDGGYRLDLEDGDTIDAVEFSGRLAEARRQLGSNPAATGDLIEDALSSWRGRPYEGFEDLPAVAPEAIRLEELRLAAIEDRIEAELRAGGTPVVSEVEQLREEHPYRERLWELLARSLYRAGRQAEALRTFTRLRQFLGEELGIEPSPAVTRVEEQILVQDPILEPEGAPAPTNLPVPVSSFVGRVDELSLLDKALHEHRLITIVAPGGAGKTRLAIEAGRSVLPSFPDGVWLVDLTTASGPGGVARAAAAAFQLVEIPGGDLLEAIADRLRSKTTLMVLDNCEHVMDPAGEMAMTLLEKAPRLKILATSRQALSRQGEIRVMLSGLDTGLDGDPAGEAERLFEQRAVAIRPELVIDEGTRQEIASICRQLDGMPLAIELAASRVDTLSPAEIDGHLSERFLLLTDDRAGRLAHRSLRASLDWSYNLLNPDEQRQFENLGIFEGGFSAPAAGSVLGSPSEMAAIDQLRRLVGASLIHATVDADAPYRMLETIRIYARDHLRVGGRYNDAADRHDRHYLDRASALRPAFFGRGRSAARAEIEAEQADYHVAFDRLFTGGRLDGALEMAWSLGHVWLFAGQRGESDRRLDALLDATSGSKNRERADALSASAFSDMYAQRYDSAIVKADESIAIYRDIGDDQGLAYVLARRGHLAFSVGDISFALQSLKASLEICERIGYDEGEAWPMTLLAQARLWSGDESAEVRQMFDEGRKRFIAMGETFGQAHANMFLPNVGDRSIEEKLQYCLETMELSERPGADPLIRPIALHNLAFAVWHSGDRERAEGLNRLAATSAVETGMTVNSGMAFLEAGLFAGEQGNAERAAVLYGAGDAHFIMQKAPFHERQLQPGVEAAERDLGTERYAQLYSRGAAMTVDQATALLLTT